MNKAPGRSFGRAPEQQKTMANADGTTCHGRGGSKPPPDSSLSGAGLVTLVAMALKQERTKTKSVTNADGTTSLLTIRAAGSNPVRSITGGL